MNSDFRVSCNFFSNLKIRKLKRRFGLEGVFSLLHLWGLTAASYPSGEYKNPDFDLIAEVIEFSGEAQEFFDFLFSENLIEKIENGFKIHEWEIHNGFACTAEKRSESARKANAARWGRISGSESGRISGSESGRISGSESGRSPGANPPLPHPYPYPHPYPHPHPPMPQSAKTSTGDQSDRNDLAEALGKLQVGDTEVVLWQALKALPEPCTLEDVKEARTRKRKNNLAFLKDCICECRDERLGYEEGIPKGKGITLDGV